MAMLLFATCENSGIFFPYYHFAKEGKATLCLLDNSFENNALWRSPLT